MGSTLPADENGNQLQDPHSMINFPQPTRPTNGYYMEPSQAQLPQSSCPFPYWVPGERFPNQVIGNNAAGATTTLARENVEEENIEELQRAILELFERLPASLRGHVNFETFHVSRVRNMLKDLNLDAASSRGVHGTVDELAHKIERFKTKTIQLGGIVKEDNKKERNRV